MNRKIELGWLCQKPANQGGQRPTVRCIPIGEILQNRQVVRVGQQLTVCRFPVAPGPANFLHIIFQGLG